MERLAQANFTTGKGYLDLLLYQMEKAHIRNDVRFRSGKERL